MRNSDRGEMNDIIAFLNARADEDELTAEELLTAARAVDARPDFTWCGGPAAEAFWFRFNAPRMLAEVEAIRRVIKDYRVADGAILQGDYDPDDPGWRAIYAARDAFKSVLKTYAKAAGWGRSDSRPMRRP